MTNETLEASITIAAPAEAVFAVLANPTSHPAIDGTGWVSKALDTAPLTGSGQMFRMAVYYANHPNRSYDDQPRCGVRGAACGGPSQSPLSLRKGLWTLRRAGPA